MKRLAAAFLLLLILIGSVDAYAEVPQLSENLLTCAKQALVYLSSGEYERLVTLLPFSGVAPAASEWESFATGNFTTLDDGVQTEYAVAYWTGSAWKVAVPVDEPSEGGVETMVLTSGDGSTFSGYGFSSWSKVKTEYENASYVTWKREYMESAPMILIG